MTPISFPDYSKVVMAYADPVHKAARREKVSGRLPESVESYQIASKHKGLGRFQ